MSRFLPPSKVLDAEVSMSIIGDGCVIKAGSQVRNSIIGIRSLVGTDCIIDSAMMMGADYYETLEECEFVPGCLPMGVGDGSIVRKVGLCWASRDTVQLNPQRALCTLDA